MEYVHVEVPHASTGFAVRVVSGGAFLEAADIEKRIPIRITTGGLTVFVVSPGMYRFYGDTAVVLGGKLRTADLSITVKKGQQITSNGDGYEESKIPLSAGLDDFELWVGAARGAALRIEAAIIGRRNSSSSQ